MRLKKLTGRFYFVGFILLTACYSGEADKNQNSFKLELSKKSGNNWDDLVTKPTHILHDLKTTTNAQIYINSERWNEYESAGHPDTALGLFVYRVITTKDSSFEEPEAFIRLYKEERKIISLLPQIFATDTTVKAVISEVDFLNKRFLKYAQREVRSDFKKYGQSDGPLIEFTNETKDQIYEPGRTK